MNYIILLISVIFRILILPSIVYRLKILARNSVPFASRALRSDLVPLHELPVKGITRQRNAGKIKYFTESRKRGIPFLTITYKVHHDDVM